MNKTTGVLSVFSRELSLLRSRRSFVLGMILLPIVSLLFLLALFGDSSLHNMKLAVVDADNSSMSRKYVRMVDAAAGVEVAYMPSAVEQGEELMMEGRVDAVLHIPSGMESDIYSQNIVQPTLYINSMKLLSSSLIYRDVVMASQTLSAGVEMQLLTSAGKSQGEAYNLALPLYYERHQLFNQYTSYGYYLTIPFAMLIVILCAITYTLFAFGMEYKEQSTDSLLSVAGGSRLAALVGKMLPYTLYYSLFAVVANFILFGVMQAPIEGSVWWLMLISVLVVVAYQSVGLILFVIFRKLMVSMSLSAAIATMSFTMSGLTFPLMALHTPIYYLAHLFPYTHYMYSYIDLLRGADVEHSLWNVALLLIYPMLALLLVVPLFKLISKPYNE